MAQQLAQQLQVPLEQQTLAYVATKKSANN
jgi:hypothetical protein